MSSRYQGLDFELLFTIELTPDGVDSACHPSEVGEMRTSALVKESNASTA